MATLTPNMSLIQSTIGVDSGLGWETNLNLSLNILDGHNHAPGSGVQINPSGININAQLPMNGYPLVSVPNIVFNQLPLLLTLNSIWVGMDGNLYFNDGAGDPSIQITKGGSVFATSSGITSGTASASFVSGVLVVNAAATTPANIQAGSILLGNNSAGSNYLTLSPPSAMSTNTTETLPTIPTITTSFMTMDTSGNMYANVVYPLTGTNIANQTITESNLALRPFSEPAGIGEIAVGVSSGSYTNTTNIFTQVISFGLQITTSGRPVIITAMSDGGLGDAFIGAFGNGGASSSGNVHFQIRRGSTIIGRYNLALQISSGIDAQLQVPPTALYFIDNVSAGTYDYSIYAATDGGSAVTVVVQNCVMVAYEM